MAFSQMTLPDDCCVEAPVTADARGLSIDPVGALPDVCAALNLSNISVQRLAVKAAIEGDHESTYQACLLDPLTAATLAPHEIRNLVGELFLAQTPWLPQFKGKKNLYPGATMGRAPTGTRQVKQGKRLVKTSQGLYDKEM